MALYLFAGRKKSDKAYQAGQFISIGPHGFPSLSIMRPIEYQKSKKEPVRAYSITSRAT